MTEHDFPYDPTYGYDLEDLLQVGVPVVPDDFEAYWRDRYRHVRELSPQPALRETGEVLKRRWVVHELSYTSTGGVRIGGWLLRPSSGIVRRGYVVGHGYGGREAPELPFADEAGAYLFLCCRGLSRSQHPDLPNEAGTHVVHRIGSRDDYILGGCVEDTWLAVSVLLDCFPEVAGHVGYLGCSFGGGIGAMAIPWDDRIRRAHLEVPSFGNQPLRLTLPTCGSGHAVREYVRQRRKLAEPTLAYHDAATAASFIRIPMHCACAKFDPAVAPPGQFAVYNAIASEKHLLVLEYGHFEHPVVEQEKIRLVREITEFFKEL